jgi:hypothetical protein
MLRAAGEIKTTAYIEGWKKGNTAPDVDQLDALARAVGACLTVRVEPEGAVDPVGAPGGHVDWSEQARKAAAVIDAIDDPVARQRVVESTLARAAEEFVREKAARNPQQPDESVGAKSSRPG